MDKDMTKITQTKSNAERVLSETFAQAIHLGEPSDLRGSKRSLVLRFSVLDNPTGTPESVIVKQTADPLFAADTSNIPATLFFNEWASLKFLETLDTSEHFAPRFYGGDRSAGLFVMEDLGSGTRLDHLLLGSDAPAAEAGLIAYARLHGRLHARSIQRQAEYLTIREALGPNPSLPLFESSYDWLKPALATLAEQLQIALPPEVAEELATLKAILLDPGPFLGFMQADSCPDNIMLVAGGWRMIDFEGAHYGHVLLEGAYCRMPMPTCWCVYRIPEPILQRAESAYREELIKGCPEAADDALFTRGLAAACITWMVGFPYFLRPLEKLLSQDNKSLALSDRERFLLYVHSTAQATENSQTLPALARVVRELAQKLSERWPEAIDPPYYPALQ